MEYVIHRDRFVTLLGEVVGRCVTEGDHVFVEFFDQDDVPKEKVWFLLAND